ncbi:MAG: hypothetical protein ACXWQ5_23360, partial [Ktedonobacterales bacterium]
MPASVAPTGTARRAQLEAAFSLCIHALVLIVCAFGAYWTMFSSFAPYDDEGYHLWVLRLFAAGHALYDSVFSYYGPFHYELWGGLSALSGVAFSTDTGRLVVWALWLGASLLLAITTRRLTGRLALAVIVQVLSFAVLAAFHYEPMYPGDTALVLVCGILAAAVFVLPARPRIALIAIGALVGAALLCKVNVGGYAAIAVGYAAVMSLPRMPWGRILRVAAIAAIVLVGPTVMTPTLNTGWTQRYAFLVAASAVGLVLATARSNGLGETADADAQHWIVWLLSGLAGALALVIGVIFALGTTPRALYESVIVTASHQASVFAFPLPLTAVALGWATAAVGLAWIVRRRPSVLVGHRRLGAVLRVLVGLV